jgi:hypothetical protein
LNNNRNNRRRGRGNRNQGGANNQNRIDSRARGNAPQLLDKYKKLAQDAQHNGDRVQAEYYLQFADHYFRVIADNKARQEEARAKRNDNRSDDRGQGNDNLDDEDGDNRRKSNRRTRSRRDNDGEDNSPDTGTQGEAGVEGEVASADEENAKPKRRARKPREQSADDAPRRKPRANGRAKAKDDADGVDEIDSSVLPPAISPGSEDDDNLEAVG